MIELSDVPETTGAPKIDRFGFLKSLLNLRLDSSDSTINYIRDRATAVVRESAIPSTRDEEWRFTDLSDLLLVDFQAAGDQPPALGFENIQPFILPEAINSRLVFVNGMFDPTLSSVDGLPDGVLLTNLTALLELSQLSPEDESKVDDVLNMLMWRELAEEIATEFKQANEMIRMGSAAQANLFISQETLQRVEKEVFGAVSEKTRQRSTKEVFAALNGASMTDGTVVHVPQNQIVETPIQLLFVSTATQPIISHPRVVVMADSNSQLTLIEDFVSVNEGVYFTNAVTDIAISDNAEVRHSRIQRDSTQAFHIGTTTVFQSRDSRYTCNAISLGAKLSRHNLEVYQQGNQTQTTLNGLTTISGDQVADTHSVIAYSKPHGSSNQVHKCIVDDRAHAVFNGKISVPKLAQLTDAKQLSQTLLLSPKARVDTKPQLEIIADNVKCTHGATVSQLEGDEIFYLRSRGIDEENAQKLLVYAFAHEVIGQIPVPSLRDQLSDLVKTQQTGE